MAALASALSAVKIKLHVWQYNLTQWWHGVERRCQCRCQYQLIFDIERGVFKVRVEKMSFEEKLIDKVRENPCLCNKNSKDYKNNRKKEKIWKQISEELNRIENFTVILFNI